MRSGAQALSVLSVPLNDHVLTTLAERPRSLMDLRRLVGSPPQTTMRVHLRALTELGVIERHRQSEFPGSVEYELGAPGRELMNVRETLDAWLAQAPNGPVPLGGQAAKSTVKALVDGWSTGIVRVLAARPVSLTELSALITTISYPALERRLGAMRLAGQIQRAASGGRGVPYAVTEWLRTAVAPLVAAAFWERRNLAATTAPMGRIDVEAALLLAVPLLRLDPELSGTCRIGVEMRDASGQLTVAGVIVDVAEGRVGSCVTRLDGPVQASASGSAVAWLSALIDDDPEGLEIGGDSDLAIAVREGLRRRLFGAPAPTSRVP